MKMIDSIYQNILDRINTYLGEKFILIFRGYSFDLIQKITANINESDWLLKSLLNEDSLIDVEKLISSEVRSKLKRSIYSNLKYVILSAEEASLLDDGDYEYSDRQVIYFINDLVDEYPNKTTTIDLIDTEGQLDSMKKDNLPNGWDQVYAEIIQIGSKKYLRPQSPNLPTSSVIEKLSSLVDARNLSEYLFTESELVPEREIANKEDLNDFILDCLFEQGQKDRYLSVGQDLLDDENIEASRKLSIIAEISGIAGYEIRYIKQSNNLSENERDSVVRPDLEDIVRELWGNGFRNIDFYKMPEYSSESIKISQGSIVERIVSNAEDAMEGLGYSDVFITAPTGAGKSLIFQLPAIYLQRKYNALTIVISPLKALMSDQVEQLHQKGIQYVEFLNSDKSHIEREEILSRVHDGSISILYLSPELLLSYDISFFLGEDRKLSLIVVDEAHLITTWGRDFRVDYWYLGTYLKKLRNRYSFPVVCLTATAVYGGDDDTVFDTIETLDLKSPEKFIGVSRRVNINFDIRPFVKTNQYADDKNRLIEERIKTHAINNEKTLVYCPYKSQIDQLYSILTKDELIKMKVGRYYSGLDKYEKQDDEKAFKDGTKPILIATKAFGMGVDISDILYVYHFAPNGTIADYVQEIGRAARDKNLIGVAQTDYGEKDLSYAKTLFGLSSIKKYQLDLVMKKLLERYDQKKKQNMLFSVADFSYIFSADASRDTGREDGGLNQKVLSTLMLIEKDFLRRYRYNVVIARPKALFTEVFACVDSKYDADFIRQYGIYSSPASDNTSNMRIQRDEMDRPFNTSDIGNIYKIDLAKLWENKFSDESFPSIKYKFYSKKLFGEDLNEHVYPRYNLSVHLKDSVTNTKQIFEDKLNNIASILGRQEFSGRFFTQKELARAFRENKITKDGDSLSALLCNLYSNQQAMGNTRTAVLQERKVSGISKYQVISKTVYRLHSEMLRSFSEMFNNHSHYSRFLNVERTSLAKSHQVKCAYFLEALNLANYEFSGGNNPQTFVRINDVRHLRQAVNDDSHKNVLWLNVKDRHKRSMSLLDYFFTKQMTDFERWNFIEKYFLGMVESSDIQIRPDTSE